MDPVKLGITVGTLGTVFPTYVQKEIARLVDQFTAAALAIPNPLAKAGDISLKDMMSSVLGGDAMGQLSHVAGGLEAGLVGDVLGTMTPGAMSPASGSRPQDVTSLAGSVTGNAMLTLSMVPESPYIVLQMICETLSNLLDLKIKNLISLKGHLVQLSNVITVLCSTHRDRLVNGVYDVDLQSVLAHLNAANGWYAKSTQVLNGASKFDATAFGKGRDEVDAALKVLSPALDSAVPGFLAEQALLALGGAPAALAMNIADGKVGLMVISQLSRTVQTEVNAVSNQNEAILYHTERLFSTIASYRTSAATKKLRDLRIQTTTSIVEKLQDVILRITAAQRRRRTRQMSQDLVTWAATLKAIVALSEKLKAEAWLEGSSLGLDEAVRMDLVFKAMFSGIEAIVSYHIEKGRENVTDLVAQALGVATQGKTILDQLDDLQGVSESDLKTMSVLVAQSTSALGGRIQESIDGAMKFKAALLPGLALSILTRPRLESLMDGMAILGLDRGRDMLAVGDFVGFMNLDISGMSYIGTAIAALADALAGIDDVGLRRQISLIRDNLIGKQTNQMLSAADTMEFGGVRRAFAIKGDISSLQKSAETVQQILNYMKGLLDQLGAVAGSVAGGFTQMSPDVSHLSVGAGGSLVGPLGDLTSRSTVPVT